MSIIKSMAKSILSGVGAVVPVLCALCFFLSFPLFTWLMSLATAQQIAPGEMPIGRFYVAFVPGADGDPFDSADIRNIGKHKGTFLLPKDEDKVKWGDGRYEAYKVLEKSSSEQLIEVHHHTGDYDFWSRYKATSDKVTPVYWRVISLAQGIYALPLAALASCLLWLLMGLFTRRLRARDALPVNQQEGG